MKPWGALRALRDLTACHCPDDYTARGRHAPECNSDFAEDVETLARAAGLL